MVALDENTLVISAEPAQTIVWSIPGRGSAYDPSGYLIRQDVVDGKVNEVVKTFNIKRIMIIGSMEMFVKKVYQEISDANTEDVEIIYKAL